MKNEKKRIVVIGTTCAGKSTFARELANILKIEYIELDALFWGPNWRETPLDKFREEIKEKIAGETWVIDGNYSAVRDILWTRATNIFWLNYSFPVVFSRGLKRTFQRVFLKKVLFSGNRETFRAQFLSRESLLWWIITTHRRRRRKFRMLFKSGAFPWLKLTEFQRTAEATDFLSTLRKERRQ